MNKNGNGNGIVNSDNVIANEFQQDLMDIHALTNGDIKARDFNTKT